MNDKGHLIPRRPLVFWGCGVATLMGRFAYGSLRLWVMGRYADGSFHLWVATLLGRFTYGSLRLWVVKHNPKFKILSNLQFTDLRFTIYVQFNYLVIYQRLFLPLWVALLLGRYADGL